MTASVIVTTDLPVLLGTNAAVILASMTVLWAVSVRLRDASIVDIFWGPGFVLVALTTFWLIAIPGGGGMARRVLLLVMTGLWGLRLGSYLWWRNHGKGEDYRYRAMRKRRGSRFWIVSLFTVFGTQAVLIWVVSLPVQAGQLSEASIGWLAVAGAAVWVVGLAFESVGDLQLARFKADPANDGGVLDTGLWRYTRHPNYFGDFCVWWGIYLVALDGGYWATIVGPLVMSVLLLRVSGVTLLEKSLTKRRSGYADYVARTNAFFPGRPR